MGSVGIQQQVFGMLVIIVDDCIDTVSEESEVYSDIRLISGFPLQVFICHLAYVDGGRHGVVERIILIAGIQQV